MTQSTTLTLGKSLPYGFLLIGLMLNGPEEPAHPPRLFEQTTKYLSVSTAFPGPTILSHHPDSLLFFELPAA